MIPILSFLTPLIEKALDFIPDPQKKAEAKQKLLEEANRHSEELLKALSMVDSSQATINNEEAKSQDKFVSRWRPAVGWICAGAFLWAYIFQPVAVFILKISGNSTLTNLPEVNMGEMMPVLLGLLGLGGLRTWEKQQGVHNEH